MTVRIFRPTYLIDELGELGRLPDGAIVNIGGTDGPYFTVGGRALLFADGSPTGPTTGGINLQNVYDNGVDGQITLTTGKHFILEALNTKQFIFDADTGKITIQGDLEVLGDTVVIDKTIQNVDQLNIRLPNTTTVGFDLRPATGVVPTVDLFQIRNSNAGSPVLWVDAAGDLHAQNLVLGGTINGINLSAFYANFLSHLTAPAAHSASQITYAPGANVVITATDVQAALDQVETAIATFTASDVQGYEFIQPVPSDTWVIVHGGNSKRITVNIWDATDEMVLPDVVKIIDLNTIQVLFNTPIDGRAVLMIF